MLIYCCTPTDIFYEYSAPARLFEVQRVEHVECRTSYKLVVRFSVQVGQGVALDPTSRRFENITLAGKVAIQMNITSKRALR